MERLIFQQAVAAALARKTGLPLARANELVTGSKIGLLKVADMRYLSFKGPEYWAEKIQEGG